MPLSAHLSITAWSACVARGLFAACLPSCPATAVIAAPASFRTSASSRYRHQHVERLQRRDDAPAAQHDLLFVRALGKGHRVHKHFRFRLDREARSPRAARNRADRAPAVRDPRSWPIRVARARHRATAIPKARRTDSSATGASALFKAARTV